MISSTAKLAVALLITLLVSDVAAQRRGGGRWVQMESSALAEGFRGVTTEGKAVPNLFEIRATGVSTKPVVAAAKLVSRSHLVKLYRENGFGRGGKGASVQYYGSE